MMRKALFLQFGWTFVESQGKISDVALIAIIITGEFGAFQGSLDHEKKDVYGEALEATSNQYDSTNSYGLNNAICGGDGCSLKEQIAWMSIQEYIYGVNSTVLVDVSNGVWLKYLSDAEQAAGNYVYNGIDSSWNWGNVTTEQLAYYKVTAKVATNEYPGTDWFIVYSGKNWQ